MSEYSKIDRFVHNTLRELTHSATRCGPKNEFSNRLLAAEGLQDKQIAERISVAPLMASRWRSRFLAQGVAGLVKDAPRPGRTPTITVEKVAEIVSKTTQTAPANATQWSRSTMARLVGISESSVGRIWRVHGLKPHRWFRQLDLGSSAHLVILPNKRKVR